MLKPVSFGLAAGILWGFVMFLCTLLAMFTGYSENFLNMMSSIYLGYSITPIGSLIGLVYGFIDAFVGFYVFAVLYNHLSK